MKLWINFIPIFIIFLLVTYTPEFVKFSHSILGKFLSVVLIIFYVKVDILAGLLVCLLVIFYYQTDYIESFESSSENSNVLNQDPKKSSATETGEKYDEEPQKESEESDEEHDKTTLENFESLTDVYPLSPTKPMIYDKSKETFRKTHCKKGHLMHKGTVVKNEMAENIFQEIKQNDFHKCNVCDPSCDFDIIEKYIKTEEDLMKPKSSNEMFETVWQNMSKTTETLLSK
jgi:hypothetical protein